MLRGGELRQLTRDHTYGQLVIEAGMTLRDVFRDTAGDPQDVADTIAGIAFSAEQYGSLTCIVADVVEAPR
jgi:hypothetical protein